MSAGAQYDKVGEEDLDPAKDKELKENGGRFTSKKAIGQVTVRLPLDMNPLSLIALTYGFLPWLIPISLVLYFVYTWHFIYLYGPLMSVVLAIINEGILKRIFNQPRPLGSANRELKNGKWIMKPGMPSGHVLNATVICVWALLEVYLKGPGLEHHESLTMTWLAVIAAVHLPVPWARWYNDDHSVDQCVVSIILGLIAAAAGFYIRVHYFSHVWKPWSEQIGADWNHHSVVSFYKPPWAGTTAAPSHDHHGKSLLLL